MHTGSWAQQQMSGLRRMRRMLAKRRPPSPAAPQVGAD
jgi:hypothetical protein